MARAWSSFDLSFNFGMVRETRIGPTFPVMELIDRPRQASKVINIIL